MMTGRVWEAPRHLKKVGQRVFGEIGAGSVITAAEVQREFGLGGGWVVGLKKPLMQCDSPLKTSTARPLIQLISAFGRTLCENSKAMPNFSLFLLSSSAIRAGLELQTLPKMRISVMLSAELLKTSPLFLLTWLSSS